MIKRFLDVYTYYISFLVENMIYNIIMYDWLIYVIDIQGYV